jgi:hypothetical protein
VQILPEADAPFAAGWHLGWHPARAIDALQVPWRALLPLPPLQLEAWNIDPLAQAPGWRAAAGFGLWLGALALVWPHRIARAIFVSGSAALIAFAYAKFFGSLRHHGHLWLLLLAALWIGGDAGGTARRRSWRERSFVALLIAHVAIGAFISALDLIHPFSNGARTAALLRAEGLDRLPLLGYREPPAAPVALALRQPLFAPSRAAYVTHTDWGPQQLDVGLDELRCQARRLAHREADDVVLVMNAPLPPWDEVRLLHGVTGAMVSSENYFLYRLDRTRLDAGPEAVCRVPLSTLASPIPSSAR